MLYFCYDLYMYIYFMLYFCCNLYMYIYQCLFYVTSHSLLRAFRFPSSFFFEFANFSTRGRRAQVDADRRPMLCGCGYDTDARRVGQSRVRRGKRCQCLSSYGQSKTSLLFLPLNKTPSQPFTLCASQYTKVTFYEIQWNPSHKQPSNKT